MEALLIVRWTGDFRATPNGRGEGVSPRYRVGGGGAGVLTARRITRTRSAWAAAFRKYPE
jgi:hypothetical protein